MLETIVKKLEIKDGDTYTKAALKGTAEGLLLGFAYTGALYTIGQIVGKIKK